MELIEAGEVDDLGPSMLVQGNTAFATKYAAMFATVVRVLCDPARQPVIVQCTAGKDRTGFAVATMLWALGAHHDTVVADYLRSNELLAERHGRLLDDARARGIETEALEALLVLRREYLDAGYAAACENYGSIDGWLRDGLGITDGDRRSQERRRSEMGPQEPRQMKSANTFVGRHDRRGSAARALPRSRHSWSPRAVRLP